MGKLTITGTGVGSGVFNTADAAWRLTAPGPIKLERPLLARSSCSWRTPPPLCISRRHHWLPGGEGSGGVAASRCRLTGLNVGAVIEGDEDPIRPDQPR